MRYIKAEDVLPLDVLELVQQYADGEMLYIPKRKTGHNAWGSLSGAKEYLLKRNALIYSDYLSGLGVKLLAEKYCLAEKSIQRIIKNSKPSDAETHIGGSEHEP